MARRYLRILSDEDMQKIHNASLSILENTGMLIDHHEARNRLQEAGAKVNHESKIVKFPPELVKKSLESIPRTLTYAGRNLENDMILKAGGDVYARTPGGAVSYIDLRTGEYRKARIGDMKEWAVLTDALPNINGCAPITTGDVPVQTADIHAVQVLLENQTKHIMAQNFGLKNLKYMIEMMIAVRGSEEELKKRPLCHCTMATVSPLYLTEDNADRIILAGEYGIPVIIVTTATTGLSAPMTLAGTIAQANAEELGGLTVTQVMSPGAPAAYYMLPMVANMSTGTGLWNTPENKIMQAAMIQLGMELYGMPIEAPALGSHGVNWEQSVAEKMTGSLMTGFAGANLLNGAGYVDTALAANPAQLVMDDEIMGVSRRMLRGIEVNDDTLGLEVISRVGPRGTFLTDEHTLKYLRTDEFFRPTIFDRDSRMTWLSKGAKGLEQKAKEKALTILEEHKVPPLPEDIVKELGSIVNKADQELAG